MNTDVFQFNLKNEILSGLYYESSYVEFYSDVFPSGSFQKVGNYDDLVGNGLAVEINKDISKHHIINDGMERIREIINKEFVIMSPISYFGRNRTARNSSLLYGIAFDIDGVTEIGLKNMLHQFQKKQNPYPTYIVNSGHGLHLYYLFTKPIKLYNHVKEPLKNLKYELTRRLWNVHTSTIKEIQYQGIFQGFRLVGSPSKLGSDFRLTAYKCGDKVDIEYLNQFVSDEYAVTTLDYETELTLEEAKIKYPEWYESKIINKESKKTWIVKRDLYDWWKKKVTNEATYGHRYFCIMVLAIYGKKCNIPFSEVKEDAFSLMPILNDQSVIPFEESDVLSALESYKDDYITFPRKDIEKLTAISIPANKRNGREQKIHLQAARAVQDIYNPNWRKNNGRPIGSKNKINKNRESVFEYLKRNPSASITKISRDLNLSRPTVYKYFNEYMIQWVQTSSFEFNWTKQV